MNDVAQQGQGFTTKFIRIAQPADAASCKAIAEAAYAKYVPHMAKPPAPVFYDYAKVFSNGFSFVFVDGEAPIAMVTLIPEGGHLLLQNLAVLPEYQRRGIGRMFLDFAECQAADRELPEIRLWTNEKMAENVPYYERLGYTVTHRAVVDGYSRIFMSKKLPNAKEAQQTPIVSLD